MAAPSRRRPRFTIAVMTLLSITVLTIDGKNIPVVRDVRRGAVQVLSPVEDFFASVTRPVRNFFGGNDSLKADNERLQAEVEALRAQRITDADVVERLRQLEAQQNVSYLEAANLPTETARLVSGPFSNFETYTTLIDKGTNSGLSVGNPVVTNGGLIGRISSVTPDRSVVQLLTDPDLRLGIRIAETQVLGDGRGAGADQPFIVDHGISLTAQIVEGQSVITSGLSRFIMPPGIPIGTVAKVTRDQSNQTQILEVSPGADFSTLNVVRVIKWVPTG